MNEFIEPSLSEPCCDQQYDRHKEENGKGQANISQDQTPNCGGTTRSGSSPDLPERNVTSHNANQPENERQDVQHRGANGASPARHSSQEEADGQVKTPLQEIKKPTKQAQDQAGSGKFIRGRMGIKHGWIAGNTNIQAWVKSISSFPPSFSWMRCTTNSRAMGWWTK